MAIDPFAVASSAAIEHLRWALTSEVGPVTFARMVEYFGSAQQALGASVTALEAIEGVGRVTAEQIARGRDGVDVRGEVELAARHGVRIICQEDDEYPPALKQIPDAPICLYVKGRILRQDTLAIGVVGSRRCTIYGREQARRLAQQMAARGLVVVSGLARGIDGEAHKGCLETGGRTLAVLGNGLSTIYPPEHEQLAEQIAANGALISELPMTCSPESKNFLPRNRIIAGLSLGVLVIEAARRSGSLTTARLAIEYNREVFALPGRVDSEFSTGTNGLIREQHAKLVTCADDILDELGDAGRELKSLGPQDQDQPSLFDAAMNVLSEDEKRVLGVLSNEACGIEQIADTAELPSNRAAGLLLTLQLKGLARQLPGNYFVRVGRAS